MEKALETKWAGKLNGLVSESQVFRVKGCVCYQKKKEDALSRAAEPSALPFT